MAARARDAPGAGGPGGGPAGGVGLLELEFAGGSLYVLRQAVAVRAAAAGMGEARAGDVVLALNELASNAVSHGGRAGAAADVEPGRGVVLPGRGRPAGTACRPAGGRR
jgi:hypothetical protein